MKEKTFISNTFNETVDLKGNIFDEKEKEEYHDDGWCGKCACCYHENPYKSGG